MKMVRVSSDYYEYDHYAVMEVGAGHWRWADLLNRRTGGEWRKTRQEAVDDLTAHLVSKGKEVVSAKAD